MRNTTGLYKAGLFLCSSANFAFHKSVPLFCNVNLSMYLCCLQVELASIIKKSAPSLNISEGQKCSKVLLRRTVQGNRGLSVLSLGLQTDLPVF